MISRLLCPALPWPLPTAALEKLRGTLVAMKKEYAADEPRWRTCATTLGKYISNVAANPDEEKFRCAPLRTGRRLLHVALGAGRKAK